MSGPIRRDFADELLWLPISSIAPRRVVTLRQRQSIQYQRLLASLRMVGLVEPLVVFPRSDAKGCFLLLDGHLRLMALRRLRHEPIPCLVAYSDEGFTYNQLINRLSPDQARRLVGCALHSGVSEEHLGKAIDADMRAPLRKRLNFQGIAPEVIDELTKRAIAPATIDILRKLVPSRQIAAVAWMARTGTYTTNVARSLLLASKEEELASPVAVQRMARISAAAIARIRRNTHGSQRAWRRAETAYSEDVMQLIIAAPSFRKLIENQQIRTYLAAHHGDTFDHIRSMLAYCSVSEHDDADASP